MAGVAIAVEGDGVGFATESYAASALYTTLASLSGALWRIRRASRMEMVENVCLMNAVPVNGSDRFPVLGSAYDECNSAFQVPPM